jgi:hypothetical protein
MSLLCSLLAAHCSLLTFMLVSVGGGWWVVVGSWCRIVKTQIGASAVEAPLLQDDASRSRTRLLEHQALLYTPSTNVCMTDSAHYGE